MRIKNKIKIILKGIVLPCIIYIAISLFVLNIATALFNKKEINIMLLQGIVNVVLLIVMLPLYLKFIKLNNISHLKFKIKHLPYIIAISLSMCFLCNFFISLIPRNSENLVSESVSELTTKYNIYFSFVIVSVIVPIIEEIIFRGFVYDTVNLVSNDIAAIIISSIFFGIVHVDFHQILYAFIVGLMLAYIKSKYKNLIYTIIMHATMNLISLVLISDISFLKDYKSIIFTLFLSAFLLIISLIRINIKNNV